MRISYSVARHKAHKRLFREAKGRWGARKNLIRTVKEGIVKSRCVAYRHRRNRKRDFRALWITRLTAAANMHGLRYSEFIHGLVLANIGLNRKSLSELAIHAPDVFAEVAAAVKSALSA
ncbi:MAG TPA: 50S ribosomal protein L20 [Planctomycetaceae bacterium]|jgi:large subunit ribosomal protein L20|nr:50S ribosomal protein L20 [Planctomycetaceae bacterium]